MKMKYNHLSSDERDLISVLKAGGMSNNKIGIKLNRSSSTISRELKRNTPPINKGYYLSHKAQVRADNRKSQAHQRTRLKNDIVRQYVTNNIKLHWTPEQISGRLSIDHPGESISHEAIYQYIYAEDCSLIEYLPQKHRKRQKRGHTRKHQNSHIPNRVSIEERPEHINIRKEIGHWESDTIGSRKSKAGLVVSVDRKSRYSIISKIANKNSSRNSRSYY